MHTFTYRRGIWEDRHDLPNQRDDEPYGDYLLRLGYNTTATNFGNQDANAIDMHAHSDNGSFLAEVEFMGGICFEVFLPDFPSAMMFIKDHAAVFTTDQIASTNMDILTVLEKLFQVQHGHASTSICPSCDPVAWERLQQMRQKNLRDSL